MEEVRLVVSEEYEGERLDRFCAEQIAELSRSYLQLLIEQGALSKNGQVVLKAGIRLKAQDELLVRVPESVVPEIVPEDIPLDILYEDSDVIVVNKPQGMVVHPAAGHSSGTLVNALLYHCKGELSGINGVLRPGIVHRIDKDTSGSVLVCKNDEAHRYFAELFKEHKLTRRYHTLVHGSVADESGTIRLNIGRNPKDRLKMAVVSSGGKEAVTHYRVLRRFSDFTYLECELETGRTHQIRVHLAHIHHPVLGDPLYCDRKSPYKLAGQCLHAKTLGFPRPSDGAYIETDAPLPAYFEHLLKVLQEPCLH